MRLLLHHDTELMFSSTVKLQDNWRSAIYAFFKAEVTIAYINGRRCLEFRCAAKNCRIGKPVRRYLDKGDRSSSGNLFKHARTCWSDVVVDQARLLGEATRVRNTLVANILKDGAITQYFAPVKKGAILYSNRPLLKLQICRTLSRITNQLRQIRVRSVG